MSGAGRQGMPLVAVGFVLIGILPAVLAWLDIYAMLGAPFELRLLVWNRPWLWLALIAAFFYLLDFRTARNRWGAVSPFTFGLIAVLLLQATVLGVTVAANPLIANLHLLRIIAALAMGLAGYYGMQHYGRRFLGPAYTALIVGMLLTIPALIYFLYAVPEARVLGSGLMWQIPGMGPVRVYGAGLEVALLLALVGHAVRPRLWLLAASVALWAVLFWSGARGATISIILAALVLSALHWKIALRLWLTLLFTALVGAGLSLLIWTPANGSFGLWNMIVRMARDTPYELSSSRIDRWIDAIGLIGERPWLGYGLSQFSNLWPEYSRLDQVNGTHFPTLFLLYRHLHNVVLEAFLALGLMGGAVFVFLFARGVGAALYRVRHWQTDSRLPALAALMALLAHSFLTGIYVFPQTLLLLGLFFGICLAPNPALNENTKG